MRDLLLDGLSVSEIASRLGLSSGTVCYHKRKLGFAMRTCYGRRYDWAAIRRHYDDGHSIAECRQRFGFSNAAWSDAVRRGSIVTRPGAIPLDQLLAAGRQRSRINIKTRLIKEGIKDHRCERCGISEWRNEPLSMSLHHVNGDGLDNRLENLELLCPNCHSQTPNFGVGNRIFAGASPEPELGSAAGEPATLPPPLAAGTRRS